jgi:hypothetical protein
MDSSLYIQSKFNGDKITKKFGIERVELGEAIKGFKEFVNSWSNFGFSDFSEFILKQAIKVFFIDNYLEWISSFRGLTNLDFQNLSFESVEILFSYWY